METWSSVSHPNCWISDLEKWMIEIEREGKGHFIPNLNFFLFNVLFKKWERTCAADIRRQSKFSLCLCPASNLDSAHHNQSSPRSSTQHRARPPYINFYLIFIFLIFLFNKYHQLLSLQILNKHKKIYYVLKFFKRWVRFEQGAWQFEFIWRKQCVLGGKKVLLISHFNKF